MSRIEFAFRILFSPHHHLHLNHSCHFYTSDHCIWIFHTAQDEGCDLQAYTQAAIIGCTVTTLSHRTLFRVNKRVLMFSAHTNVGFDVLYTHMHHANMCYCATWCARTLGLAHQLHQNLRSNEISTPHAAALSMMCSWPDKRFKPRIWSSTK